MDNYELGMTNDDAIPADYNEWLVDLKQRIHQSQQKAMFSVNKELVILYWNIGNDILKRQTAQGWGTKVIERLSKDLRNEFPDMKGFSSRNLKYMRAFAKNWNDIAFVQEVLAQLPWYHHITILDKIKTNEKQIEYINLAIQHGWSRNILVHHIEAQTAMRIGKAQNNFDSFLPKPQSDLAKESIKDPYKFDFLTISADAHELEIKKALVSRITDFLMELGSSFAYVGKEVLFEVGGDDFFADLLFYHLKLHCYVVIELKTGKFKPEYLGQLSFFMTAVDKQIKSNVDAPTIGLLLCKSKNKLVVEYALKDVNKPIGISEYDIINALPDDIQSNLPTIEEIEAGLQGADDE